MTSKEVKSKDGKVVKFGKGVLKDFMFEKGFQNLNHGSFGTYPTVVRDALRSYQDAAEARPDTFIRYMYPNLLDNSRAALSTLLHAPLSTIVLIPNATTALNTILRNLTFSTGDRILYFATIYGSCEKTVAYITETTPASSIRIPYTYPVEDAWLLSQFHATVDEVEKLGGKVKLAIFDTVVSMPGVRMPFEALTTACRERNVLSCIDGAHGVGHIPLDLSALDPDFFFSNAHKWMFAPRGCGVLYVPERHHHLIRSTLPTSYGFMPTPKEGQVINSPFEPSGKSAFVTNFEFMGTVDNAPYLCVPEAIAYRERIGGEEAIMEYCRKLAKEAGERTAQILGTERLDNATGTLSNCAFANVRLPLNTQKVVAIAEKNGIGKEKVGMLVRDWVGRKLVEEHNTFLALLWMGEQWWVRWSAQIYLELSDFEWAAEVLKEICVKVENGEFAAVNAKL